MAKYGAWAMQKPPHRYVQELWCLGCARVAARVERNTHLAGVPVVYRVETPVCPRCQHRGG